MNALVHDVLANGWLDEEYVEAHTLGLESLRAIVEPWTAEAAAAACDVSAADIREAARIFGTSSRILSTVLQGFYQSAQATAASCQVNNLHLLRGLLGRPGSGILQMNGQPTAQNNRECGADGDLPGFRNWENPAHIAQLAALWDVDPMTIPHWAPPTHAMQIFRYAEQGSIEFLWISATNPAVSMPELPRIRDILAKPGLFVVVQDLYLTETAQTADVVLPAAGWGEKNGDFHQRQSDCSPLGQGRGAPRGSTKRLGHFPRVRPSHGLHYSAGKTPAALVRPRGGFRSVEGMYQGPSMRLHRDELWEAQRRQRHSVALQRRESRWRGAPLWGRDLPHGP